MRVVAFTCLVGSTPDTLRVPGFISPSVRYVCLSDRKSSPHPYKHVPVTVPGTGRHAAALYARQLKILADHPALGDADIILWHDAAFQLHADPALVARQALRGHPELDMVAFAHPDRTQIEDEAVAIAKCEYADLARVKAQAAHYRAQGWTQQTVITSTGYSLRRRTDKVEAFNRFWWAEVERWCWRDQMSVDYSLWKTGVRCGYIPGHYRDNPYAKWHKVPSRPVMPMPRPARTQLKPARPSWPYRRPVVRP
jgi:hypothetical protein